jgi:S1-C subfamily serine protease
MTRENLLLRLARFANNLWERVRPVAGTGGRVLMASLLAMSLSSMPGAVRAQQQAARPATADAEPANRDDAEAGARLRDAVGAVVRVKMSALRDATSMELLGPDREGTGVVIDSSGLILTIGYIVVEASRIEVFTAEGKSIPATLVGFDQATGFGLLRASLPLNIKPVQLGDSSRLEPSEAVLVASAVAADVAYVASRRTFTGYWEYILEDAIFTTPPRGDFAGAALIGRDGRLLGIGSLFVADAMQPKANFPGNMFIPINALRPIFGDLIANGRRTESRPWLGVHTQEIQGRIVIVRVTPESPAQKAGLRRGDIITSMAGQELSGQADLYRRVWASGKAGVQVPLQVLQGNRMRDVNVMTMDRSDHFRRQPSL